MQQSADNLSESEGSGVSRLGDQGFRVSLTLNPKPQGFGALVSRFRGLRLETSSLLACMKSLSKPRHGSSVFADPS